MKSYDKLPINVRSYYAEDFDQGFLSVQVVTSGGAGALFGAVPSLTVARNTTGVGQFQTGTTATSSVRIFTTSSNIEIDGGSIICCVRVNVPTLFDATNDGLIRFGLGNVITATTTDQDHAQGIYFEYDRSLSANWRFCTAQASTRTKNDSGVAVTTGFKVLCFVINNNGTSVQFYINGIATGSPITTNMPIGLALGFNGYVKKKAGTTNRLINIDYAVLQKIVNTSR